MKLWDQEMMRRRAFPLTETGNKIDVVKSVCRGKVMEGAKSNFFAICRKIKSEKTHQIST